MLPLSCCRRCFETNHRGRHLGTLDVLSVDSRNDSFGRRNDGTNRQHSCNSTRTLGVAVYYLQTAMRDESTMLSSGLLFSVPSTVCPSCWFVHGPRRRVWRCRRGPGKRHHAVNQLLPSTLPSRQGTSEKVWLCRRHALRRGWKRRCHRQWTLDQN